MSPFLTYTEVMPSKPSKEICGIHLPNFLKFINDNNPELIDGAHLDNPLPKKRKKVDDNNNL